MFLLNTRRLNLCVVGLRLLVVMRFNITLSYAVPRNWDVTLAKIVFFYSAKRS